MKNIKASVIIPVYNEELYLPQCLDSILSQTLQGIEIICIDDGSTDHSLEILYEYATKDSRIKVFTQQNRYAGTARNLGMKHARGKYLSFLDADDFFSPLLLEKLYAAAEKQTADIVMCNIYHYDSMTGQASKRNVWEEAEFLPKNRQIFNREDVPEHLFQLTNGWAWDKLFRTSFIQNCGLSFVDTRVANDGYFVYMALAMAERITKIDDYLVTQRVNNANSLSNTRKTSWYCGIRMLYDIKGGLKQAGLYNKLEKTFLNFALKYLVWAFENLKDWNVKKELYSCIQSECKETLKILQADASIYYYKAQYETYLYIETHSFEDYLIETLENKNQECEEWKAKNQQLVQKAGRKIWPFPYTKVEKNSTIVLYGAGQVGHDYYCQIAESGYCNLVLWLDQKFKAGTGELPIQGWRENLNDLVFDQVVIALLHKEKACEAMELLKAWGISEKNIVWSMEG